MRCRRTAVLPPRWQNGCSSPVGGLLGGVYYALPFALVFVRAPACQLQTLEGARAPVVNITPSSPAPVQVLVILLMIRRLSSFAVVAKAVGWFGRLFRHFVLPL